MLVCIVAEKKLPVRTQALGHEENQSVKSFVQIGEII